MMPPMETALGFSDDAVLAPLLLTRLPCVAR